MASITGQHRRKGFAGGLHIVVAFVIALAMVVSGAVTSVAQAAIADYTVQGVSPRGTTINVFDYWIDSQSASDQSNPNNWQNRGINAGHVLKFGQGMGTESYTEQLDSDSVNHWTGNYGNGSLKPAPRQGIVSAGLGEDGYPALSGASDIGTESLAYLFNSSSGDGKAAYTDVDGLLQVDGQGYYYYNSQRNFAEFGADGNGSGSFTLYNTWGVEAGGQSPDGQFFPFNTGDQVFDEGNGELDQNGTKSTGSVINHYFGLSMSTRFVQQYGGHTDEDETTPVTYNFSGDDDVWVYIDGVLVGDLGGIHDKASLQINFATGEVVVYSDGDNNDNVFTAGTALDGNAASAYEIANALERGRDVYWQKTTLAGIMTAAGVTSGLDGDTLADDTYHTLDFFYLERGNTDSNMSLKYNLVNIPESGVLKVDQSGRTIEGVGFELYKADESYNVTDGAAYYTGRTGTNGELVFTTTNDAGQEMPVTLEQLSEESPYWVLRETDVPEGYRDPGDIQLRFEDGVLLSSNAWSTGAWSQPHVTATATDTVYKYGDDGTSYADNSGTMFAVVLQKQDDGTWAPVSGDAMSGWSVGESLGGDESAVTESLLDAAKSDPYRFVLGSGGAYEVDIEDLPGDITTYAYMLQHNGGNESDAEYTVAYYHTDADSLAGATTDNTVRLDPDHGENDGFDRVFSVTLNVANIKNELSLVKTDADTGEPIEGVEFKLYRDEDGNGVPDTPDTHVNTMTTDSEGKLQVTSGASDGGGQILANGQYVLVETNVPDGSDYKLDTTGIKVVVDDSGVYVDAGQPYDHVSVETSVGSLVAGMRGFAADDDVDATLHDVQAQPQTADYDYDDDAWGAWGDIENTSAIHYHYNAGQGLAYQPTDGNVVSYTAISGWSRLNVTQCTDEHDEDSGALGEAGNKQDLEGQSLNALFTGDVTIHVTNRKDRTPATLGGDTALQVQKTVTGANTDADFAFSLTLKSGDPEAVFKGDADTAAAGNVGDRFGDGMTVTMADPWAAGDSRTASFDDISFTEAGTYVFEVKETTEDPDPANGWTYDNDGARTITVTVGVDETGALKVTDVTYDNANARTEADQAVTDAAAFTNSYATGSIDYGALIDLQIAKTLNGRDMTKGQFSFTVTPNATETVSAEAAAKKLGIDGAAATVGAPAADDGETAVVSLLNGKTVEFTQADAGKTFSYTVRENAPESDADGYTYDRDVYTVEIAVRDNGDGTLSAVTTVSNGGGYTQSQTVSSTSTARATLTIPFVNSYEATTDREDGSSGAAAVSATKSLTGRDLQAGEFSFAVAPRTANGLLAPVATATNAAGGTVDFGGLGYTTADAGTAALVSLPQAVADGYASEGVNDDGQRTWTVRYTAYEATGSLPAGVSANASSVDFTVTVVDNGDGTLSATADLPQGGIAFTNTYSTGDEPVSVTPSGSKSFVYADGEAADPDFEGRFTFTLSSDDPTAPMPAGDGATATNDANGNVTFGAIAFDLDDLAGVETAADGSRSKTFTYTVTESGSVDSVTNDATATRTFTITLTDDGQGHLTAVADPASGPLFVFTNTYTPGGESSPTGEGGVSVTKSLTGRDLRDGEFSFTMNGVGDNAQGMTVTGTNDADGTVTFGAVSFDAPGTYTFDIAEDHAGETIDGVTYDDATYTAIAEVTDNGDGTLAVAWSLSDADGDPVDAAAFENAYRATMATPVTLGATKTLSGAELTDGRFTFQLTGADADTPMPADAADGTATVANAADGTVRFGGITYTAAGTYTYTLAEVDDGQDGVTYDDTAYTVTVTVTDDGDGTLSAAVDYGDADGATFDNVYTAPSDPGESGEPGDEGDGDEGDGGATDDGGSAAESGGDGVLTQTGAAVLGVAAAIVALVAIAGVLLAVRRRASERR